MSRMKPGTTRRLGPLSAAFLVGLAAAPVGAVGVEKNKGEDKTTPEAICRTVAGLRTPPTDRPATLPPIDCDSEALYYGVGMRADPSAARDCAFAEAAKPERAAPIGGAAMLMTIYANGVGAKRNLDVALALACGLDGAPAEFEGRVRHLDQLRKSGWTGTDFSWCDDITSGAAQGACAEHDDRVMEGARRVAIAATAKGLTGPAAAAHSALTTAFDDYLKARGDNEVDMSGTGRLAMLLGEQGRLRDEFAADLKSILTGGAPRVAATATDADKRLNDAYKKLQGVPATDFNQAMGTIRQAGIKTAQRAWIKYRDAWVALAKVARPDLPSDAILAWLTERRTEILTDLTP